MTMRTHIPAPTDVYATGVAAPSEGHLHVGRGAVQSREGKNLDSGRLLRATFLAAGAAALANAVIGRSAAAAFDIPPEFLPLSLGATIVVSLSAALAVGATLALLGRVTR